MTKYKRLLLSSSRRVYIQKKKKKTSKIKRQIRLIFPAHPDYERSVLKFTVTAFEHHFLHFKKFELKFKKKIKQQKKLQKVLRRLKF